MAALSGEKTLAELSAQLGVHPTMISSRKPELVKTPRRDGLTGGEKNAALCQRAGPGEGSVAALSTGVSREFGTVEQDTAGPPQTPDRSAFGIGSALLLDPAVGIAQEFAPECQCQTTGDLTLRLREAGAIGVEPICPQECPVFSVDQLSVHLNLVAGPPHTAFQHIT